MPIRPVRRPSRKLRLQSASARSICDSRCGESRAGTTLMMRRLLQPFWVLLAVIFLIEAWLSAITTIIFAKFLGVGVAAFVFDVTRHKLLEMAWFETLYEFVISLRAKAAALVDPIKLRIMEALRGGGGGWSSRMLRLIQRFRKSVHEAR